MCDDYDDDFEEDEGRSIWNEFLELANDGIVYETEDSYTTTTTFGLSFDAKENPLVDYAIRLVARPQQTLNEINMMVNVGLEDAHDDSGLTVEGTVLVVSEDEKRSTRVSAKVEPALVAEDECGRIEKVHLTTITTELFNHPDPGPYSKPYYGKSVGYCSYDEGSKITIHIDDRF